MDRIDNILNNKIFMEHYAAIEMAETDRIYCRHDMVHFLDVARIATILAFEKGLKIKRDIIYAAALLHDVGRDVQYNEGVAHEVAGAEIAPDILKQSGYDSEETDIIIDAIREHGNEDSMQLNNLTGIIYRADKLSRKCFMCKVGDSCHKALYKRNMKILY